MSAEERARIQVVAGVLVEPEGRVLIAQRPLHKHLGGRWEFPGGKLEPGEQPVQGLTRELREEIGVLVHEARPLIRIQHEYADRDVDLHVWIVTRFEGEPVGLEGQQIAWCPRQALPQADLVPADKPIVTALRLPERIVALEGADYSVLPSGQDFVSHRPINARLQGALCRSPSDVAGEAVRLVSRGADFVLLPSWFGSGETERLATSLGVPVYLSGVALDTAWRSGASGIHEIAG
ncbi:MAG TPA: 8-oxo-dGTP diphosphatase MutT [Steroidobacteraceae bacterium]